MQLKELSVILTIAKHRSITNAAKELFVTQPALSMYLNNVETQLGTALFDRQEKPIKLTPAGELYVRKAKQIMLIKSEFDMELSTILSTHSTSITIALQTLRVPHLEPPLRTLCTQNSQIYSLRSKRVFVTIWSICCRQIRSIFSSPTILRFF